MMDLIDHCRKKTIDGILALPDVKERIDLYRKHAEPYRSQIERCSREYDNVLVTDFRGEEILYIGNRFLRYALYPKTNISIQIMPGLNRQNTVITLGKSIFNKTSRVNIGELLLEFSGGGHENAGTCQVENEKADEILQKLIDRVR
jgi:nanoRNase/pAp phosphatase (c-di-AMP/oligoRNAs hydrolase)